MTALSVAWRVVALTLIVFVCFALGAAIVGFGSSGAGESGTGSTLILLAVCFVEVSVIARIILRARWGGWRLVGAVMVVFYGVTTFMPQIESAVFITRLPAGTLPRLFALGALVALPFSVLAVPILGKRKPDPLVNPDPGSRVPAGEWTWKILILVVLYLVLYFTFGYFVAWKNPAVREYYGGTDPGSFVAQMQTVTRDSPWLVPFQILRGLCWVILALITVRVLKGSRLEAAITIGLLFGLVMNAQLLLPNPYMPEPVRMAHLVETATSNFIFGGAAGWVLERKRLKVEVL